MKGGGGGGGRGRANAALTGHRTKSSKFIYHCIAPSFRQVAVLSVLQRGNPLRKAGLGETSPTLVIY